MQGKATYGSNRHDQSFRIAALSDTTWRTILLTVRASSLVDIVEGSSPTSWALKICFESARSAELPKSHTGPTQCSKVGESW